MSNPLKHLEFNHPALIVMADKLIGLTLSAGLKNWHRQYNKALAKADFLRAYSSYPWTGPKHSDTLAKSLRRLPCVMLTSFGQPLTAVDSQDPRSKIKERFLDFFEVLQGWLIQFSQRNLETTQGCFV
jgi:hypothetical protein